MWKHTQDGKDLETSIHYGWPLETSIHYGWPLETSIHYGWPLETDGDQKMAWEGHQPLTLGEGWDGE